MNETKRAFLSLCLALSLTGTAEGQPLLLLAARCGRGAEPRPEDRDMVEALLSMANAQGDEPLQRACQRVLACLAVWLDNAPISRITREFAPDIPAEALLDQLWGMLPEG